MPFAELSKIALLGTEHSHFPDDLLQQLKEVGLNTESEPTVLLTEAAALFAQIKKAGFPLIDYDGNLPETIAWTEEATCSQKSVNHLRLILEGKFAPVFPEFLHHLLENEKRLPTEHVPALMALPNINEWWSLIELVLDRGGKWLIAQHPAWKLKLGSLVEVDWESGSKEDRLLLLQQLRKQTPQEAIALLESTWLQEDFRDRAAFVKVLKVGLSGEDEPFLEKALKDTRKEVRTEATALLPLLPLSDYSQRMFERAVDCLFYEKRKWQVQIPDEPDGDAISDGILKIHPDWNGAKAGYLGQLFSQVPPSRWELHFEAEPEEVLHLFSENDWADTIQKALAQAAILHEDEKWIGAVLSFWFEQAEPSFWTEGIGRQIMENAPGEAVNQLGLKLLAETTDLPDDNSSFFQLIKLNDSPWQNELTSKLIGRVQDWLYKYKGQPWLVVSNKMYLEKAALRCNPDQMGFLQKGWDHRARIWYDWERDVEEMLNTLLFRKEMVDELGR